MGMHASVRMMVRMGSTRSTTPTTNLLPPTELISMRSPTTNGLEMNCRQCMHSHGMAESKLVKASSNQQSDVVTADNMLQMYCDPLMLCECDRSLITGAENVGLQGIAVQVATCNRLTRLMIMH